jgi:hypothetical protein
VVAASSYSNDGDVEKMHPGQEAWIIRLDASGVIHWQQSLGGKMDDNASSIQQVGNGGYLVSCSTQSHNGDVTDHTHFVDYWIVRLDNDGIIAWQETLGGEAGDWSTFAEPTLDGGFIVTGYSSSTKGDVIGHHGSSSDPDY